jgi:hypothetical protein
LVYGFPASADNALRLLLMLPTARKFLRRTQTARITSLCHYTAKKLPEQSGSFHFRETGKLHPFRAL